MVQGAQEKTPIQPEDVTQENEAEQDENAEEAAEEIEEEASE